VSEDDLWELFGQVGEVQKVFLNYDRSGRSSGTATVIMNNRVAAQNSVRRYNGVALDGAPLEISIVSQDEQGRVTRGRSAGGFAHGGYASTRSTQGWGGALGGFRGGRGRGGRGGRVGRGRGRGRRDNTNVSQEDLDAELDQYQSSR